MNVLRMIAVASCAVLLVSCSASTPTRTQYLLRTDATPRSVRVEAPIHVGLGTVTIAPYLRQSGIVVAADDGRVRVANQHLWAEPLDAGLRSYLRAGISEKLGYDISSTRGNRLEWDYAIDVEIDRLHGTMAGTAVLDASYRITPHAQDGKIEDYRFSDTALLRREGYPGLVDAETGLVAKLAQAIAASLGELNGD